MSELKNPAEKKGLRNNYFLKAFVLGLGLSFLIFIPFIIRDGGRFLFYGDFNVQQVAFYRIAHDAVRSGNIGWSHLTDLGANFIGSYSFYLLGSPFFWLTIPFPSEWLQYLMGPLFMLKFACACLTGYVFIHRYVRNQRYGLVGAVLYAFSGFSIYNIFFNHFHEAIIVLPLLLAALDEFMYKGKRGLFALAVAFCAVVNYYFFVGMVTFTAIYFFVKLISGSWKIGPKRFLCLAIEAVLGLAISSFILMPSVLCVIQNNRVDNYVNGWSALLYDRVQRYLHIIESFFFLPDLPARPNFTPDSNSKWSSIAAYMPLFSMTGVIGWLQLRRKHWLKRMIYICFAMALIPGLNSMFQLMNGSYYARWFYMLTLVMSLATAMSLDCEQVNWHRSIKWTALITAFITAAVAFTPTLTETDDGTSVTFGLEQYPTRLWSYAAVSFISIALLVFLLTFCRKENGHFTKGLSLALSLVVVLESVYFIALGKTQSADPYEHIIPYALNGGEDVNLEGIHDGTDAVRTDFYESMDNAAMFWEVPSIQAFHSIVPGSVMDFYTFIGVTRDVASRPDTTHYGLRGLTSVKWLFDDADDDNDFTEDGETLMPGWDYYGSENGFEVYENSAYIPMGFSYDCYITYSEAEELTTEKRELAMLRAIVLDDDIDEETISTVRDTAVNSGDSSSSSLEETIEEAEASPSASASPSADTASTSQTLTEYCGLEHLLVDEEEFDEEGYFSDCADRKATSCEYFTYTNSGFEAVTSAETSRIMFFSVPYEDGWTAYVNGIETKIYKANVGFMAVVIPAGETVNIEFRYTTPGLKTGIIVSIVALILLGLYMLSIKAGIRMTEQKRVLEMRTHKKKPQVRHRGSFAAYARRNSLKFVRIKRGKYFMVVKWPHRKKGG